MKIRALVCSAIVLTMAACGSGGDSGSDATATTGAPRSVSGNATKGPLEGATVSGQFLNLSGLTSGGRFDAGATDVNGNFNIDIDFDFDVPPFLRLDTGGGSYVDEADPAPENGRRRIEFDTETGLSAIFPSDNNVFPLNLVTQLLSAKSLEEASGGSFGQVFLANRQAAIEAIGFDVFNVVPADPLNPAADTTVQQKQYGMILGALAQGLNRVATELGFSQPLNGLLRLFSRDLSDGNVDGREFGSLLSFGEGGSLPQDTDINAEIERFRNNNFSAYVGVPLARFDEVRLSQTNGNGNENQPPVAADDNYSVARSETLNVAAPGVLSNDTDPDDLVFTLELLLPSSDEFSNDFDASGSVVALEVLSPASAGEVILNDNGSFSYSHDGSRTSFDSFGYRLIDSAGNSDTATVSITITGIEDIPVAVNDSVSTEPGVTVNFIVVGNDIGPVDPASIEVVDGPTNGVVDVFGPGVFAYTPNSGFEGGDSFTYRVANSQGDFSAPATVSISVIPFDPGNESPQADSNDIDVFEDELAEFSLSGTDSDGSVASFEILSLPSQGTLFRDAGDSSLSVGDRLNATNNSRTVFYAGDQDFNGGDDFGFRVFDNGGAPSQEAVVTINVIPVNDAPVIFTGQLDVVEHDNLSAPPGYDISEALGADDVDNSIDELIYTLDLAPTEGELALDGQLLTEGDSFTQDDLNQGIVEYFHFGDEPTDEFFDITVTDPEGDSDSGTVFVVIEGINDPPEANDDLIADGPPETLRVTLDQALDIRPAWDPREGSDIILFQTNRAPSSAGNISNLGGVLADGSGEMNFAVGPNSPFGLSSAASSWVGLTGRAVLAETVSTHEYLEFDVAQAPFTRTVFNGNDAAHRLLLSIPGGGGGGFMEVSRDGSTAIWRVSSQGGGGTTELRVAPYANLVGQTANSVGTVVLTTFTGTGAPQAFFGGTALSPDGALFVQAEPVGDGFDLFLRSSIDGALIRQLTDVADAGGSAAQPDFAPVGDRIVFTQRLPGEISIDLFVLNIDGSNLRRLTNTPNINENEASFAPDGLHVAYRQTDTADTGGLQPGEPDNANIYVADFFTPGPGPQEGEAFSVGAPGLLFNDVDVDGDPLTVSQPALTEPEFGTLTLNADGSFTYEHDGTENFTDQFEYEIIDPDGETDTALVDIVIEPVNDVPVAVDDSLATDEDTAFVVVSPDDGLLGNDSDGEDDPLSVASVNGDSAAVGTEITLLSGARLTLNADGTYLYNPIGAFDSLSAGEQGTDSFAYTVSDGEDEATGTVTVTIDGINDAPIAVDDIYTDGFPGQRITVDPNRDIQPAWDPRVGSELIIFRTGRAPGGASVNNLGQSSTDGSAPEGNLVVGPNSPFGISAGEPSFVGTTGLAVLNRAQGAHSYLEVNADTGAQIRNVLTIPGGGGGGWMTVSRDGSTAMWRYSQSGGAGATELRIAPYGSLTGQSANAVGTVVVSINLGSAGEYSEAAALTPDGSAFVLSEPSGAGRDLFLRSSADGSLILQLTSSGSVLGVVNREPDVSPDGQTVAFARNVPNGASDVFTIGIDGSGLNQVTATDDASELDPSYASDGLRLAIRRNDTLANGGHDGSLPDNNNIYVININGAQTVGNGVAEGGTLNAAIPGVLANDTDVEGDTLQVVPVSSPANAESFVLNADGSFTYTHDGSETTSDSFSYRARDPSLAESGLATVTIDITPLNDPPVAVAESATTDEDNSVSINVLANDTDAEDGTPLGAITIMVEPSSGSVVVESDRTITYTPDQDFNGQDSFEYAVADFDGAASNNALVSLTVNAVNDAPVATDDSASTDEDTQFTVTAADGLLFNDSDIDSVMLSVTAVNEVAASVGSPVVLASGALLTVQSDGGYSYDPNGQFESFQTNTPDSFSYTVSDGGLTDTATVTITITPVNDAPVAADDTGSTDEDSALEVPADDGLLANDNDVDSSNLSVTMAAGEPVGSVVELSSGGLLTVQANGSYSYDSDSQFESITSDAMVTFDYTISDGESPELTGTATVSITITPLNDAPVLQTNTGLDAANGRNTAISSDNLLADDVDNTAVELLYTVITESGCGNFTLRAAITDSFTQADIEAGDVGFLATGCAAGERSPAQLLLTDGTDGFGPFDFEIRALGLQVVAVQPAQGQEAAPANTNIGADFVDGDNQVAELAASSVNSDSVAFHRGLAGRQRNLTFDLSVPGQLRADPAAVLQPNEVVEVTYTPAIQSTSGLIADAFVSRFRVAAAGSGVGEFTSHPQTPEFGSGNAAVLASGDIDGDGDIDIALGSEPGTGSIWLNDGIGNYSAFTGANDWNVADITSLVLGDIDGDGDLDAFIATADSALQLFVNDGNGLFTAHPSTPSVAGSGVGDSDVVLGDLDGDGDIDAVVSTFLQGSLILSDVYLNDGSGVFTPTPLDQASVTGGRAVALADINHDGSLDIIIGRMGAGTLVALNNGNAMFEETYLLQTEAIDIIVADFNGDGFADVAALRNGDAVDPEGEIHMLFNDGAGAIIDVVSHFDVGDYASFDVGDVDADGDLDFLLTGGGLPTVVVFNRLNETSGGLVVGTEIGFAGAHDAASLADIDGDGDLDFVTTALAIEGSQSVWLNNTPPLAQADALTTDEDSELNADLFADNSSSEDADDDGDSIIIVAVNSQPNLVGEGTALAGGSLLFVQSDGSMTLQPGASFESLGSGQSGSEAFSYTIADGNGGESTATVTVTITGVNDAPVAVAESATTDEDNSVNINVLSNDSDAEDVTPTGAITIMVEPTGGSVAVESDRTVTYTPNLNFNGSDSFEYTVADSAAAVSNNALVSLTVNAVNDAPVLTATDFAVDEDNETDTANGPDLSQFISSIDPDNGPAELTYTLEAVPGQGGITRNGTGIGLGGTFTQTQLAAGEIAYEHFGDEPDGNPDSFTLTVRDPGNLGQTATVMVTINAVNDAPELDANDFNVDEGATFTLSANELAASDEESSAADLVYQLDTAPTQGTLFVDGIELVVPAGGGGGGGQGNGQSTITTDQFTQADVDTGLLTYEHSGDEPAAESFAVTVRDNGGDPIDSLQASATLAIIINPVNDLPELVNNTLAVDEGDATTPVRNPVGTSALQVIDAESGAADLVFQLDSEPANGLLRREDVVLQAGVGQATFTQADIDAGLLTYEHDGSETTSESIALSVTDEGEQGLTLSGIFVITVNPVNDAPVVNQLQDLLVSEGATAPLTTDTLNAFDEETTDNSLLVFTVPASSFGDFLLDGNVSTSFSQQDIEDGLVAFQHNPGALADSETFGTSLTDNDPIDPQSSFFNFTVRVIRSPFVRRSTTSPVGQDADGAQGDAGSDQPSISGNGQHVLFRSLATNFRVDGDGQQVYDKLADNALVTLSMNIENIVGDGPSDNPHASWDGGRIVFDSAATNLDLDFQVSQGVRQIYTVVDGRTRLISLYNNGEVGTQPAGGLLEQPRVSADGRTVVFQGYSSNYPGSGSLTGDPATTHVYAAKISSFELDLPTVLLLDSAGPDQGFASSEAGSQAGSADISQNGRYAVFVSTSQQIIDNDTITGFGDIFRKDLETGEIELVSINAQGIAGDSVNGGSFSPSISGDGRLVAFISSSTNLIAQDNNSNTDVFVKDMDTGVVARVNTDGGNISSGGDYFTVRLSGDGRYLVYDSANDLLDTPNGFSGSRDIHIKQLALPLQTGDDTGPLQRLNRGLGGDGQITSGDSFEPELNFDGSTISFVSNASNLVIDDTNGADDVFTAPNPFFTASTLDSDGDGLTNAEEAAMGTNPFRTDTDEDLIFDGDEGQLGTSPLNPDSDDDDIGDGTEVAAGSDPLMPQTNRLYVSATGSGDQSGSDWSNTLVGNGLVGEVLQSGATPADASYVLYQAGDNVGPGGVFGSNNVVLLGGVADGQPTPGDNPGSYTRFDGDSDGDGAPDGTALLIDSADNVQIRNIRMTNGLGFSMDAGGLTVNFPFGSGPLPTVRLINSEVVDNVGTGVAISGTGQLDVVGSRIANNDSAQSGGSGGGINLSFGGPVLQVESSVIADNRSGFNGGGINLENDAIAVVTNSIIIHNSAPSSGGGVYVSEQSSFTGTNNLFLGNVAADAGTTSGNKFGGGIGTQAFGSANPASIFLSHSTVAFNQALTAGGGFASVNFSGDAALLTFTDNIFYFNDDLDVANPTFSDEFVNDGVETNISFNDIQSSSENQATGTGAPVFDFDPMFTPALRLAENSLAVDRGSQAAAGSAVEGLSTRGDGAPDTSTVDLGFHFDRTPVVVNQAFNLNDNIVAPQGQPATLEFTGFATNFCDVSTDPLPGRVVSVRLVSAGANFTNPRLLSLTTLDPLPALSPMLTGGVMATDNGASVYRVQFSADNQASGTVQLEVFFDIPGPPLIIDYFSVQLQ